MTTPQDAGIFAEGLGKRYGDLWALRDVDLAVPPGTVLGLLGHNGAGKTTAVRILTTLAVPDAGPRRVAGHDVVADPATVRTGSAWPASRPPSTGCSPAARTSRWSAASTTCARRGRARPRRRAARAPRPHRRGRPARRTYSGGMRRRLDLAAPSSPPRRSSSSTSRPRASIRAAASSCGRSCASSSATARRSLLTTQYLEEADRLADDIVVLDGGRVVAQGAPRSSRPASAASGWRSLVGSAERARAGRGGPAPFASDQPFVDPEDAARRRAGRRPARLARGRPRTRRRRRRRHRRPPSRSDARRRLPLPHRPTAETTHGGRRLMTAFAAGLRWRRATRSSLARRNLAHVRQIPEKLST